MKIKWLKYYLEIPGVNLVISIFDPRMRINYLQDYLTSYYDYLFLKDNDNNDNNDDDDDDDDVIVILKILHSLLIFLI
jgi:hypothetical protein